MEYSNQYFEAILTQQYPKETTRNNYIHRMNKLLEVCNTTSLRAIIEHPDTYYPSIRDKYPNISTRKNVLTLILAFYKHDPSLQTVFSTAHKRWLKLHDDLDGFQSSKYSKNLPDMKQIAKYTPMEELRAKYNDLAKDSPWRSGPPDCLCREGAERENT